RCRACADSLRPLRAGVPRWSDSRSGRPEESAGTSRDGLAPCRSSACRLHRPWSTPMAVHRVDQAQRARRGVRRLRGLPEWCRLAASRPRVVSEAARLEAPQSGRQAVVVRDSVADLTVQHGSAVDRRPCRASLLMSTWTPLYRSLVLVPDLWRDSRQRLVLQLL